MFIHFHVHTIYSFLDGALRPEELIQFTLEHNLPVAAMTDHGNIRGAMNFHSLCKKSNIIPAIGAEFYLVKDMTFKDPSEQYRHLVLLATNAEGFKNLIALNSIASMYFYKQPRIDKRPLEAYRRGLVALSGCLGGVLASIADNEKLEQEADWFQGMFGDNFFIEIMPYNDKRQGVANTRLIELGLRKGIKILPTNDVHYYKREHDRFHKYLYLLQTNKTIHDHSDYNNEGLYLRTEKEMKDAFMKNHNMDISSYIDNSEILAKRFETYGFDRKLKTPQWN